MAQAGKKFLNWYPGHMFKSMQVMMGKLNSVDCVVEVHDARIPLTGRNTELKRLLGAARPHVLVLNKRDLAELSQWDRINSALEANGDKNVLLTDMTGSEFSIQERGYTELAQRIVDSIRGANRYNRQDSLDYKIMIVGIPNVGKSTLINRLRQHHAGLSGEPAETGRTPGVTRHVMQRIKICNRPPIYVIDTPGVLMPAQTASRDQTMKLALCSTITDKVIDNMRLSAYLLEWLHAQDNHSYMIHMNLIEPPKDHNDLLIRGAIRLGFIKETKDPITKQMSKLPDVDKVALHFIKGFRQGLYGKVMLDIL